MAAKQNGSSTPGINAALITEQVDELGAIEKELAPLKLKIARGEALRKAIRAHFDKSPANQGFEALGTKFTIMIGPKGLERKINFPRLVKKIGLKAFAVFASCTLAALEAHVPPGVFAEVTTQDYTGSRTLKTFERGKPE